MGFYGLWYWRKVPHKWVILFIPLLCVYMFGQVSIAVGFHVAFFQSFLVLVILPHLYPALPLHVI